MPWEIVRLKSDMPNTGRYKMTNRYQGEQSVEKVYLKINAESLELQAFFYNSSKAHAFQNEVFNEKVEIKSIPSPQRSFKCHIPLNTQTTDSQFFRYLVLLRKADESVVNLIKDICLICNKNPSIVLTIEDIIKIPGQALEIANFAQHFGSYSLLFELVNHYHRLYKESVGNVQIIRREQLERAVDQVIPSSPYHALVRDLFLDVLLEQIVKAEVDNSIENNRTLQEKAFAYALVGSRQKITDRLFADLCGASKNCECQENIQGDYQTLLKNAENMYIQQKKLKAMEAKIAQLVALPSSTVAEDKPSPPPVSSSFIAPGKPPGGFFMRSKIPSPPPPIDVVSDTTSTATATASTSTESPGFSNTDGENTLA